MRRSASIPGARTNNDIVNETPAVGVDRAALGEKLARLDRPCITTRNMQIYGMEKPDGTAQDNDDNMAEKVQGAVGH